MHVGFICVAGVALAGSVSSAHASTIVPVENDFFTTAWAFGAPYVRDAGRSTIGVSTPNPFLFDSGTEDSWEETTYFTFDFNPGAFTEPVTSAYLEVSTFFRPFGTLPSDTDKFGVSAHRVTDDPMGIDGSLASGVGSYIDFKNNMIGAAEDTILITGDGLVQWDITALVNEWIANGDANFDYSIAMTGRIDNPADTDSAGFFHAFANSGEGSGGQAAQLVIVPAPASAALLAGGSFVVLRRRR